MTCAGSERGRTTNNVAASRAAEGKFITWVPWPSLRIKTTKPARSFNVVSESLSPGRGNAACWCGAEAVILRNLLLGTGMHLQRSISLVALSILAAGCVRVRVASPTGLSTAITARDLETRLTAFAHDSMMGREAGTVWNTKATDYVASEFRKLGLQPAGENGTFFQVVPNVRVRDSTLELSDARNVIGVIPATDPALRGQHVATTAH